MDSAYIHIPNPCNEKWEEMTEENGGRNCGQCNRVIYDLSLLSDDALLNFFKGKRDVHCGRFHQSQLDRLIVRNPAEKKRQGLFAWYHKALALVIGLLLFKSPAAKAGTAEKVTLEKLPLLLRDTSGLAEKVIISGYVTDIQNQPLKTALVKFINGLETATDENGYFSFTLERDQFGSTVNAALYFEMEGYISAVRSYHIAMQSTGYNVQMSVPTPGGRHTMGIMVMSVIEDLPVLKFKPGVSLLNGYQKNQLSKLGMDLKNSPAVNIIVQGYVPVHYKKIPASHKRVEYIKKYLVNSEGINPDRITTNIEVEGGDFDTIDIINN